MFNPTDEVEDGVRFYLRSEHRDRKLASQAQLRQRQPPLRGYLIAAK